LWIVLKVQFRSSEVVQLLGFEWQRWCGVGVAASVALETVVFVRSKREERYYVVVVFDKILVAC